MFWGNDKVGVEIIKCIHITLLHPIPLPCFLTNHKCCFRKILKTIWCIQGHRTRFETFQTNNFSWFNDIVYKDQWFLGSWVVEIYAWSITWNFFDLIQPQQPPMCKLVKKNFGKKSLNVHTVKQFLNFFFKVFWSFCCAILL